MTDLDSLYINLVKVDSHTHTHIHTKHHFTENISRSVCVVLIQFA